MQGTAVNSTLKYKTSVCQQYFFIHVIYMTLLQLIWISNCLTLTRKGKNLNTNKDKTKYKNKDKKKNKVLNTDKNKNKNNKNKGIK